MLRPKDPPADAPVSADSETRVRADHHESLRLWLRMLACTNLIEGRVRQALSSQFETTLPRFDLMAQLERHPAGLTMGELSRRMMVTGGNVTGIADGLEEDGLIERGKDARDRRALRVRLTPRGHRAFLRMAALHEQWVVEMFAGLKAEERARLAALLGRLKSHVAALPELRR